MESRVPAITFIFGIACIIAGVAMGEGKMGIFIIFPFIYGEGALMFIGMILIFLSFPIFMISQFHMTEEETYRNEWQPPSKEEMIKEKHMGGLILIGPIPMVISSDKKLALILMAVGMVIVFIFFFNLTF